MKGMWFAEREQASWGEERSRPGEQEGKGDLAGKGRE